MNRSVLLLDSEAHWCGMASDAFIEEHRESYKWLDEWWKATVMMTLGFMQCKNVERIDTTATDGPPPKWCRRQRLPELKYHSLRIDPNFGHRAKSGERKTEGDRSGKALHICRGYFMHCVNDGVNKGLFGKGIYGTFWVPSHVRGSADLGKVIPTYNVLAPTG